MPTDNNPAASQTTLRFHVTRRIPCFEL